MLTGLFDLTGVSLNPDDLRAMSEGEIAKFHASQLNSLAQATRDSGYWKLSQNWVPYRDERPLDERFADFKRRLTAAIEKRRKPAPPEGGK